VTNYIIRRLIETIIVLIVVTILAFLIIHVTPGDPVQAMFGFENANPEQIEMLRHELWLDRPIFVQYTHWLSNALHGDFGKSITYNKSVTSLFASRLPITVYLSGIALVLSTLAGIIAGTFCAIKRGGYLDQLISVIANIGIAVPIFWLGILGIYILSLKLNWLPVQGWVSPTVNFWDSTQKAIMPVILLAVPSLAILTRQTRSSMLEVVQQDYIRTAVSKGLTERAIILRHALKNALIPVITLLGLQVRLLVGGSVLVETVFNIPGMGRLLVDAAMNKDFPVIQGGVLVLGLAICLVNLLVDISYGWFDPRVKYA
jgi:peptide/nickel transport system permease protein